MSSSIGNHLLLERATLSRSCTSFRSTNSIYTHETRTIPMARNGSEPKLAFFDLPPEIRLRVYWYCFPCRSKTAYNPVLHYRRIEPCQCFKQPLMLVSKQVRSESVSFHYSIHEFHFVLFPPNKSILLSWLDNMARDSISYVRRLQLKRYVEGHIHYLGERIMAVTIDLSDESEVEVKVAGKPMALPTGLSALVRALPYEDGRQRLTRGALLELFEFVGWH